MKPLHRYKDRHQRARAAVHHRDGLPHTDTALLQQSSGVFPGTYISHGVNTDSAQPPSPDKPPSFLQRKQRTTIRHGSLPVPRLRPRVRLRADARAADELLPRAGQWQASLRAFGNWSRPRVGGGPQGQLALPGTACERAASQVNHGAGGHSTLLRTVHTLRDPLLPHDQCTDLKHPS